MERCNLHFTNKATLAQLICSTVDVRVCVCVCDTEACHIQKLPSDLSCKYLLKLKWVSLSPPPPLLPFLSSSLPLSVMSVVSYVKFQTCDWGERCLSEIWHWNAVHTSTVNDQCSFSENRWMLSFSRWTDFWNGNRGHFLVVHYTRLTTLHGVH